jgi:hypothetical protein
MIPGDLVSTDAGEGRRFIGKVKKAGFGFAIIEGQLFMEEKAVGCVTIIRLPIHLLTKEVSH